MLTFIGSKYWNQRGSLILVRCSVGKQWVSFFHWWINICAEGTVHMSLGFCELLKSVHVFFYAIFANHERKSEWPTKLLHTGDVSGWFPLSGRPDLLPEMLELDRWICVPMYVEGEEKKACSVCMIAWDKGSFENQCISTLVIENTASALLSCVCVCAYIMPRVCGVRPVNQTMLSEFERDKERGTCKQLECCKKGCGWLIMYFLCIYWYSCHFAIIHYLTDYV